MFSDAVIIIVEILICLEKFIFILEKLNDIIWIDYSFESVDG